PVRGERRDRRARRRRAGHRLGWRGRVRTQERPPPRGEPVRCARRGGLPPVPAGTPAGAGSRRHRERARARAAERDGRRRAMTGRRVAITGIGVVAPGGVGTKAFWALLTDGRTATRPISTFDASAFRSRVAAEIDFDPALE